MSFAPDAVTPEYSLLMTRETWAYVRDLEFPRDWKKIAFLNLNAKMVWWAAQDPQDMIDKGLETQFRRFWFRYYLLPLKIKRFLYRFKFWSVK